MARSQRQQQTARTRFEREGASVRCLGAGDDRGVMFSENAAALWSEMRLRLDEVLMKLPAAQREAFVMRYLDGRPVEDVARELGCPLGTASARISRALMRIRSLFTAQKITLTATALAILLGEHAAEAAPAELAPLLKAGCAGASGGAGSISATAVKISELAMKKMFWIQAKWVASILICALLASAPAAYMLHAGEDSALQATPTVTAPIPAPQATPEITLAAPLETVPEIKMQIGHFGLVRVLCYSADGSIMATGGRDNTVIIWDTATGKVRHTLIGHTNQITALAFRADGKFLVSGSFDHSIKVWDTASGELKVSLPQLGRITALVFAPQGNTLAAACWAESVALWDIPDIPAQAQIEWTWPIVGTECESVAISSDGKTMATGTWDAKIRLWNLETKALFATLPGHTNGVTKLAFSPDGKWLASGSGDGDGSVRIWDLATLTQARRLPANGDYVNSLVFSPDGSTLVSSKDFSSGSQVWNAQTGALIKKLPGAAGPFWFAPDGLTAIGVGTRQVLFWDTKTWTPKAELPGAFPGRTPVFSPDGKILACASWDKTVRIWDAESGELLRVLRAHADKVEALDFSPDGKWLASGCGDGLVRLWETQTWTLAQTLKVNESVLCVTFLSDSLRLAVAAADGSLQMWDAKAGQRIWTIVAHDAEARAVAISSDGKLLVSAGADNMVKFWDALKAEQGVLQVLRVVDDFNGTLHSVSFAPPQAGLGAAVAVPTGRTTDGLKILNAADGSVLMVMGDPRDSNFSTAFSPDGRFIAAAGQYSVRVFDSKTGTTLGESPPGLNLDQPQCTFSPDSGRLATVGNDGVLRIFRINADGSLRLQAAMLGLPSVEPATDEHANYLTYTPEGYYAGTAAAEQLARWQVAGKTYDASKLKALLNRADFVRTALAGQEPPPIGKKPLKVERTTESNGAVRPPKPPREEF